MSILKIARMGHPVLRTQAVALDRPALRSSAVQKLIDDMIETMTEYRGVGLAAPQVHEELRIFVALIGADADENDEDDRPPLIAVNPEILPAGPEMADGWEGCLSVPDIRGRVPRARAITLRALNRKGERIELPLQDFPARVVQHETDHLDGILFFDRMRSFESLTFLDEYARFWAKD
jgi:peptide deformylase